MKIVLLPGMDGTGKLFAPFLHLLSTSTIIIPFPQSGSQSYEFLASYVETQLPNEKFIIVAESFSGPIAALLAAKKLENLKGIVFIATFLSCPKPTLVLLAKLVPVKSWLGFPFAKYLISRFFLGSFNYSKFVDALNEVPNSIIRERLSSIRNLKKAREHSNLPSIYLSASSDYLVSSNQITLFHQNFSNLKVEYIEGTHFLLQSNPRVCSEIINKFVNV